MMTEEKKEVMKKNMQEELRFKQGEEFVEGLQELTREFYV